MWDPPASGKKRNQRNTKKILEHLQQGAPNPPYTPGWTARSLTGHEKSTQTGASNEPQTLRLTGTPHIHPKYGEDMGWLGHERVRLPHRTRPMLAHSTTHIFIPIRTRTKH